MLPNASVVRILIKLPYKKMLDEDTIVEYFMDIYSDTSCESREYLLPDERPACSHPRTAAQKDI